MFVANDSIPKLGYLTSMDKFSVACFFMLFLSGCETAVVFWVHYWRGAEDLAVLIDTFACIVYIPLYLAIYAWEGYRSFSKRRLMNNQIHHLTERLKNSSDEVSIDEISAQYETLQDILVR